MKEALENNARSKQLIFNQLGCHFKSSLIKLSAEENSPNGFIDHLEYHPIVNSRAHKVGRKETHQILNVNFRNTYNTFLQSAIQKTSMDTNDKLILVYYL